MGIYHLIIFTLLFLSVLEIFGLKRIKFVRGSSFDTVSYIGIATVMSLVAVLAYECGRDWENYIYMYYNAFTHQGAESGYMFINQIFLTVLGRDGYWVMRSIILLITTFIVYRFIYKNNEFPIFILCIYFLTYFFSTEMAQTRQFMAMAILILGNRFIEKRKILLWTAIVALSMLFHVSAILAFPLYFTNRIKVNPYIAIALVVVSFFINVYGLQLTRTMLKLIGSLPFVPTRLTDLIDGYMLSKKYGQQGQYSSGFGLMVKYVFYVLMVAYHAISDKRGMNLNFLIGLLLLSFGRNFDQINRVAKYYFVCGNGLSEYNILASAPRIKKSNVVITVVVCIVLILFTYNNTKDMYLGSATPEYIYKSHIY